MDDAIAEGDCPPELAVLAVVSRGETYGYRIVEELKQLAGLGFEREHGLSALGTAGQRGIVGRANGPLSDRAAAALLSAESGRPRAVARDEPIMGADGGNHETITHRR